MKQQLLSQEALDVLEENGYRFKAKGSQVSIIRSPGVMGAIVVMIIALFASIPIFSLGAVYGVGFILAVLAVIILRRVYFSDRSNFLMNQESKTFSAKIGTYYEDDQPMTMISSIVLHSQFIDQYVTAARNSVEEHLISIRIQLITKEDITLLKLKSEHAEPTAAINEIYHFLEDAVKDSKVA